MACGSQSGILCCESGILMYRSGVLLCVSLLLLHTHFNGCHAVHQVKRFPWAHHPAVSRQRAVPSELNGPIREPESKLGLAELSEESDRVGIGRDAQEEGKERHDLSSKHWVLLERDSSRKQRLLGRDYSRNQRFFSIGYSRKWTPLQQSETNSASEDNLKKQRILQVEERTSGSRGYSRKRRVLQVLEDSPGTMLMRQRALVNNLANQQQQQQQQQRAIGVQNAAEDDEDDDDEVAMSKGPEMVSAEEVDEIAVSLARHSRVLPREGVLGSTPSGLLLQNGTTQDHPHSAYLLGTKEGLARESISVAELARFRTFNLSDPAVRAFARLADAALLPWSRIDGVTLGMGSRGMISPALLNSMSTQSVIMEACAHIKIVDGSVFFRYGGFMYHWFRLRRLLQTVKMIQDAVTKYGLTTLRAEFFLNTRDIPMSFDNSLEGHKAGYPVFSVQKADGSIDIVYPDPIDLSESYATGDISPIPWQQKKARAVFRGATTNYPLKSNYNWRVNPRLRLHRMTDVRPDLIDARVMRWSKVSSHFTLSRLAEDRLELGDRLSREEMAKFKYEIVVDGAAGSSRTCNTLASDQAVIKQQSQYSQFFQPLLRPYSHYIPTTHFFDDLFDQIQWARQHDPEVHKMVKNSNEAASRVCTWSGRTLYWAILLVKYSRNALENAGAIQAPAQLCRHTVNLTAIRKPRLHRDLPKPPPNWPPSCEDPNLRALPQPPCTFYCEEGNMSEFPQIWIPADVVDIVPRSTLKRFETVS